MRGRILVFTLTLALTVGLVAAGGVHAFSQDSMVWKKCTQCHPAGADGKIARVEELRTTPEEWTVIVDRMRRLHKMDLNASEMDTLLKELCSTQILTPEEQAKVSYLSLFHNSQQMEAPADKDEERLFAACVRCHSAGKIFSYRMTKEAWAKVRDFHLFVDPAVIYQMREMHWRDEADAILAYLATARPYGKAWSAPAAKPEGSWAVFGYEPGKGSYRGEAEIVDAGNGEYKLTGSIAYSDGTSETFGGQGTLYGGYALRTRTQHNGFKTWGAYSLAGDELRGENHFAAPHFRTSSATWARKGSAAKVVRVSPSFLLKGEKTVLTVEGLSLPEAGPADISFSGGEVKVLGSKRLSAEALELQVVSNAGKLGEAKLTVKGVDAGTVKLAPKIDSLAVSPAMGRARVSGGPNYPAEGVQFEAIAYAKSGKGKKAADVALGPVPATFQLTEEKTRPTDDDLRWVGGIQANGTYLPVGDYKPNPAREYSADNLGLVKVLATYKKGQQTYTGQAQLTVTVPDFIQRIR